MYVIQPKKQGKQKKSLSNLVNSHSLDYANQQQTSVCHIGDHLMMHDTPPNSAESYSGYIEVRLCVILFKSQQY